MQQHRQQPDGQISYSHSLSTLNLHITNIVNQIDCDDSLVLTPSISHLIVLFNMENTHDGNKINRANNNNNNKKRATPINKLFRVCGVRCALSFESMPNTQFIFMDQTEKSLLITLDKYYN